MIELATLQNGLRVLLEPLHETRTCAIGVYVESGSRHEPKELWGISHFIEHMVFKGTKRRRASDLARDWDLIGGQSNAFTSKENTVFYATVRDEDACRAVEILGDMLCHSRFDKRDVDTERAVILEEINMYEDSPEDLCVDKLMEGVWQKNALGREILGSAESLEAITPDQLRHYIKANYTADNTVISVAGAFSREAMLEELEEAFASYTVEGAKRGKDPAEYIPSIVLREKSIEQNHICLGFPGLSYNDPDHSVNTVLGNILGAGMSSRLFQRVREQLGLAYTIYSFSMPQKDCGFSGIYFAGDAKNEAKAIKEILLEVERICRDGVTAEELKRTKAFLSTNLVMGFESSSARMSHNARDFLMKGSILTPDELEREVRAVTANQVKEVATKIFKFEKLSVSVIGAPRKEEEYLALRRAAGQR